MRLAWVTPLGFDSGVSRFSLSAVRALASLDGVEVEVWHDPTVHDLACPFAPTHALPGAPPDALDAYDAVVYNLGNHPGGHGAIYERYRRTRGIVVLHDKVMHDFFFSYACEMRKDPRIYVGLMGYVYGGDAAALAADIVLNGQIPELWSQAARYPLFEPCLFNALGVVTHSAETRALVDSRYHGLLPSLELQLPHFIYDLAYSGQGLLSREKLGLPADKVVLAAAGRLGAQKRVDVTMRVIAADPALRDGTLLVVGGGGDEDYPAYMRQLANELGVEDGVRFVIEPDDRTMHSILSAADIAINLRYPSTESGSASLVEQLYFHNPVVVTRIGVYDELPDDVVIKIDPENEFEELTGALSRLVLDPGFRARTVSAVEGYSASHFSADTYARRLLAFVGEPRVTHGLLGRVDAASANLAGTDVSSLSAAASASAEAILSATQDTRGR